LSRDIQRILALPDIRERITEQIADATALASRQVHGARHNADCRDGLCVQSSAG
jgi:hypothetical protein